MSRLPTGISLALELGDDRGEAAGERHAAGRDAEQDEAVGALVGLEDLVGDATQGPGDVGRSEDRPPVVGRGVGLTRGALGRSESVAQLRQDTSVS